MIQKHFSDRLTAVLPPAGLDVQLPLSAFKGFYCEEHHESISLCHLWKNFSVIPPELNL